MSNVMNFQKDMLLKQAILNSGYYENVGVSVVLDAEDTIEFQTQVSILLARELEKFRPDLFDAKYKDCVYVVCNGKSNYSLPSSDLTSLMETEKPYDDSYIGVFSLSERKIISKLYKGDGTKWVIIPTHKGD